MELETTMSDADDFADALSPKQRKRLAGGRFFWILVFTVSTILLAVWATIEWTWSLVDDPGQVIALQQATANHGLLPGIAARVTQLAIGDYQIGVFRPLAWIYPPLIYSMPPTAAHVIRLAMLLVIVIGPLAYFRKSGASPARLIATLLILVTAASTLYQGLWLTSIQEVGGVALISLGLIVRGRLSRLVIWTLAALFKGPFVWILFGYGIVLWRQGHKKLSVASLGSGLTILLINITWSRGVASSGRYQLNVLDPELWKNAAQLLQPQNGAILLAVVSWLVVTRTRLMARPDFPIFAIAAVGYYLQMIPWGFTAYYMGPISFLFGLVLVSMLEDPQTLTRKATILLALGIPFLTAVWVLKGSLTWVIETNAIVREASHCLKAVPNSQTEVLGNWLYVTTTFEGPVQLQRLVTLSDSSWQGSIKLDSNGLSTLRDGMTTHLLVLPTADTPALDPAEIVCQGSHVTLIRLK